MSQYRHEVRKKFTLATVAGDFKGTVFSKKYMGYHIVAKEEQLST
jgi:hypothetical protein